MCGEGVIDKFPQVDNCCCCCKMETGSKVIAWLGLIGSFSYAVVAICGILMLADHPPEYTDKEVAAGIAAAAILLIYLVSFWVMDLLLLIGLYKDDKGKVSLWLRVNMCLFFYGFVAQCLNIAYFIYTQPAVAIGFGILGAILNILMSLYMIVVVKSHYYSKTQGVQRGA